MPAFLNRNRLRALDPRKTAIMLCDIQEKFRGALPLFECMVKNTAKLLTALKEFDVPLFVTEQYPEKLGHTEKSLDISHACCVVPKTRFSMLVPEVSERLSEVFHEMPRDAVVFGVEAHVCVEQTAIELLDKGVNVFVLADCSLSRCNQDRDLSFLRLQHYGCIMCTYENIVFNFLQDRKNPKFKKILKTLIEPAADMQLATSGCN